MPETVWETNLEEAIEDAFNNGMSLVDMHAMVDQVAADLTPDDEEFGEDDEDDEDEEEDEDEEVAAA
jgi:hypothetical protein